MNMGRKVEVVTDLRLSGGKYIDELVNFATKTKVDSGSGWTRAASD